MATVWDLHTANDINTIEKVQRRAARWVTNRHHQTSCVNSIINSLAWPTFLQRRKELDSKCFTHFTTTSSPLILNTYHSQQKADRATERTTHTATTSLPAGHSTDICHSSPGPYQNGTACPRKYWQPSPWTVSIPGLPPTCNHDRPPFPSPSPFVYWVYYPPLLCHTPFHYISEVSTATSTYQHNDDNIDVG